MHEKPQLYSISVLDGHAPLLRLIGPQFIERTMKGSIKLS